LEKDKKAFGKYEILGFQGGPVKSNGKEVKEVEHDPLTQSIEEMKIEHVREMNVM